MWSLTMGEKKVNFLLFSVVPLGLHLAPLGLHLAALGLIWGGFGALWGDLGKLWGGASTRKRAFLLLTPSLPPLYIKKIKTPDQPL